MNPTDGVNPDSFFADVMLPLSRANLRLGVRYLKREREPGGGWGPVASRTGGWARIPAARADGDAMLDQLGRSWAAEGDKLLPRLIPLLADLRRVLLEPRVAKTEEAELPEFVYPLF